MAAKMFSLLCNLNNLYWLPLPLVTFGDDPILRQKKKLGTNSKADYEMAAI